MPKCARWLGAVQPPRSCARPLPYLGYASGAYLDGVTDWILKQAGVQVHVERVYETDMAEGLKVMALECHAIAFLPRSAVKKEIQAGTLVEVSLPGGQTLALSVEVRALREKAESNPCFKSSAHQ